MRVKNGHLQTLDQEGIWTTMTLIVASLKCTDKSLHFARFAAWAALSLTNSASCISSGPSNMALVTCTYNQLLCLAAFVQAISIHVAICSYCHEVHAT